MIQIDFNQSSYDTLPPVLRTLINFHWVQVLIKPLKDCYDTFTGYTFDNDFEIKHNSQVLSFEDYLNVKVPWVDSRVYIGPGQWLEQIYMWYQSEIDSYTGSTDIEMFFKYSTETLTGVTTEYFRYGSEYLTDTYDFVVYYDPYEEQFHDSYLEDLTIWINKLRIIGTTWKFVAI